MPLCFAYGSNMDVAAMAARCPGARALGLARLARHRLAVMAEGFLTVVPDSRGSVSGLLWDVPLADMPALDRYEEIATGLYAKRQVSVLSEAGPRRALVYLGRNAGPGAPRPGYLENVVAAGRAAGLPAACLRDLESLGHRSAGIWRTAMLPCGPVPAVRPTRLRPADPDPLATAGQRWSWEP